MSGASKNDFHLSESMESLFFQKKPEFYLSIIIIIIFFLRWWKSEIFS